MQLQLRGLGDIRTLVVSWNETRAVAVAAMQTEDPARVRTALEACMKWLGPDVHLEDDERDASIHFDFVPHAGAEASFYLSFEAGSVHLETAVLVQPYPDEANQDSLYQRLRADLQPATIEDPGPHASVLGTSTVPRIVALRARLVEVLHTSPLPDATILCVPAQLDRHVGVEASHLSGLPASLLRALPRRFDTIAARYDGVQHPQIWIEVDGESRHVPVGDQWSPRRGSYRTWDASPAPESSTNDD